VAVSCAPPVVDSAATFMAGLVQLLSVLTFLDFFETWQSDSVEQDGEVAPVTHEVVSPKSKSPPTRKLSAPREKVVEQVAERDLLISDADCSPRLTRPLTKSSSDSKSEMSSNVGRPCWISVEKSKGATMVFFASESSSSIVDTAENSDVSVGLLVTPPTVRLRGSQKSKSCSDSAEGAYGGGDGDRDGHAEVVVDTKSPDSETCDWK